MKRHLLSISQVLGNLALAALAAIGAVAIARGAVDLPAASTVAAALEAVPRMSEGAALEQTESLRPAVASADTASAPTVNYQGVLRNLDGKLETGTHDMAIRIYSQAAGGAAALYVLEAEDVSVVDGVFNVVLGGEQHPLGTDVFAEPTRYIGITLDDAQYEIQPRQRVHMVPWAIQATIATTLVSDAAIQGLASNGDVSVTGALSVSGNATVQGVVKADTYHHNSSGRTIKPIYDYYKVTAQSGVPGTVQYYEQTVSCTDSGDEAISGAWVAATPSTAWTTMGASRQLTHSSWYFRMDRVGVSSISIPYSLEVLCADHTP